MVAYILKSTACLAILLLFYRFFLEKESMHTFKRFYLLGSLILSLIIPLLVFVEYVTVPLQQEVNTLNTLEPEKSRRFKIQMFRLLIWLPSFGQSIILEWLSLDLGS